MPRTPPTRYEAIENLDQEFENAKFATLLRLTHKVETLLGQLEELGREITLAEASERPQLVARYAKAGEQALAYRYYLKVQRDVMQLTRIDLEERYPVPELRSDDGDVGRTRAVGQGE